jgi:hypothetical protein
MEGARRAVSVEPGCRCKPLCLGSHTDTRSANSMLPFMQGSLNMFLFYLAMPLWSVANAWSKQVAPTCASIDSSGQHLGKVSDASGCNGPVSLEFAGNCWRFVLWPPVPVAKGFVASLSAKRKHTSLGRRLCSLWKVKLSEPLHSWYVEHARKSFCRGARLAFSPLGQVR